LSASSYRALFAVVLLLPGLSVSPSRAQPSGSLIAPAEVVLYAPPALKSRDFIDPLVCALRRVLVAPVQTVALDISFSRDMLATPSQLNVDKVANHFIQTTAKDGTQLTFKYLLLPYDLKAKSLNYVFATSYGNHATPYHIGVISTARLDVGNPLREHHTGAAVTAHRVYKLVLKSIARVAGLTSLDRCILAFPRSLPELDQKSPEFCPQDRDTLVAAGILKAEERDSGDCVVVSDRGSKHPRIATLSPR
jgi:predicted Zn-dependent protease